MTYRWDTPIRYVRGLGPVKAKTLTGLGIRTVGDLLERHPLSYIYPGATSIADAKEGMVVIRAKISRVFRAGHGAMATLVDDTGMCKAQWFHAPWLLQSLRPGMTVTFWGKMKGGVLQQPKWTTVESTMANVYGGQYGVHHATIRAALVEVLANVELPEMADGWERDTCFMQYHFPACKEQQQSALADLKRDEALCLQTALAERRRGRESVKGEVIEI